jgi:hypothetical protein
LKASGWIEILHVRCARVSFLTSTQVQKFGKFLRADVKAFQRGSELYLKFWTYTYCVMKQIHLRYNKTPILKSKLKDQRSIIADILLGAGKPLSFGEIVAEARRVRYEDTFKRGTMVVTVEESVQYHLDAMTKSRTVEISN